MGGETRRKFDRDFREGAVRLVRETGVFALADAGPGLQMHSQTDTTREGYRTIDVRGGRVQRGALPEYG